MTTPQPTDVKFFLSTHTGAPELTGAAGAMQAILNACLVTGFNISAVDSITRDGTTVTVTVSAGHGFEPNVVVAIAGADQAEYNGNHRITTTTAAEFTFELADGVEPATPATGTTAIDCRQAPAGWERSFASGDNQRAAFKSLAVDATGFYLYIDDTNTQGTRRAGVKGYESMSDIDTGVNPFPYSSTDDQWLWWYKSNDDTTVRNWAVIADDKLIYIWWNCDSGTEYNKVEAFGDLNSFVPADAYHFLISGDFSASDNKYSSMLCSIPFAYETGATLDNSGIAIARDYQGVAAGKLAGIFNGVPSVTSRYNSTDWVSPVPLGYTGVAYPSPVSGAAHLVKPAGMIEVCGGTNLMRGALPGIYAPLNGAGWDNSAPELVAGSGDLAGHTFLALRFRSGQIQMSSGLDSHNADYCYSGRVLIDISGAWRD